jgi:hypothetical protein
MHHVELSDLTELVLAARRKQIQIKDLLALIQPEDAQNTIELCFQKTGIRTSLALVSFNVIGHFGTHGTCASSSESHESLWEDKRP